MKFTLTIILLIQSLLIFAQPVSTSNKKAEKAYKKALTYYQARNVEEAIEELQKAIDNDIKFVDAYIVLSQAYTETNEVKKAIEALTNALNLAPHYYAENYYNLAKLQYQEEQYQNAFENIEEYLQQSKRNRELTEFAERLLASTAFAKEAIKQPVPFDPINMGPEINSTFDEYFPSITTDDQTFLYTRKVSSSQAVGGFHEDFYMSQNINGKWLPAYELGSEINSILNEGAPTISADGQLLIYTACELYGNLNYGPNRKGYGSCDLFYARKIGKKWSPAKNLGPTINSGNWESQPSFSSDGKTLYFVRGSRKGAMVKNMNIYTSVLQNDGYWSKPEKLGNNINTSGNEASVLIHPDNQTLYFSSAGHPGFGGEDLFLSRRLPNGEWGKAENLGYPINTSKNENSLLVSARGNYAYFASNRVGGLGGLDLYYFELPAHLRPNAVTYAKGMVYDKDSGDPLEAHFELIDLESEKIITSAYSDPSSGEFMISVPTNKDYVVNASKQGYLFYSESFQLTATANEKEPFILNIPLSPIKTGASMVLKNVFFNTGSFELRPASKIELLRFVDLMNKNAAMKIEVGGHTDSNGPETANKMLSENRAKSVYEFLVQNGVKTERLTYKGYGESMPILDNETEVGRQKNRRTEFKVLTN
ncbi:MAG: outer membrane protein OmpA-like peptidoglycan-associated protein [Flavobacteriales bacterium]|jgi:outer membrane protein OmpA-like peptidoglycan-associated protein/tetratricopeptide (TPR) repeat protein